MFRFSGRELRYPWEENLLFAASLIRWVYSRLRNPAKLQVIMQKVALSTEAGHHVGLFDRASFTQIASFILGTTRYLAVSTWTPKQTFQSETAPNARAKELPILCRVPRQWSWYSRERRWREHRKFRQFRPQISSKTPGYVADDVFSFCVEIRGLSLASTKSEDSL